MVAIAGGSPFGSRWMVILYRTSDFLVFFSILVTVPEGEFGCSDRTEWERETEANCLHNNFKKRAADLLTTPSWYDNFSDFVEFQGR